MTVDISLKELISTGAHFGHQVKRWNPKMSQYLYGDKEGVHIFDLTKSKVLMEEALSVIKEASKNGKVILFVGTKKQVKDKLAEVARESACFYVNERWLGGSLTNFEQMKRSTRKLTEMKKAMEAGEYRDRTKKERLLIQREIDRLTRFFAGVVGMDRIPDLMIIIDIKREKTAVEEASELHVQTVAIVDSNCDPDLIDYPIPMNDDASKALEYVLDLMKQSIQEGKNKTDRSNKTDMTNTTNKKK